jgi:hypothetical protein
MLKASKPNKISDLAGGWDVSDEEVETIKKSIKEGWRRWKNFILIGELF